MNRDELLAEFRQVADDTAAPYAWSDRRVLRWLSEGQDKFCEEIGGISDVTTYQIETQAGVQGYNLNSRILEVEEVWVGSRRLSHFTENNRPSYCDPGQDRLPISWQADRGVGMLTLFEPPLDGIILSLHVRRYSKTPLSQSGLLEIPERFHLAPVEYAAFKAFGDHDRERQDPVKAKDHRDLFLDYCNDGRKVFSRLGSAPAELVPNSSYVV